MEVNFKNIHPFWCSKFSFKRYILRTTIRVHRDVCKKVLIAYCGKKGKGKGIHRWQRMLREVPTSVCMKIVTIVLEGLGSISAV